MIKRCTDEGNVAFANYGGRGITVCERWQTFVNFLADMGERPDGTSLDRFPNVDGNYEPGNCRWATSAEQSRNRRPSSRSGKLEAHEPDQIRWLKSLGFQQRSIARFFEVSEAMVSLIVNGGAWT